MCNRAQELAVEKDHSRVVGSAEPQRALGDRVEYRLLVGGRARDRAEDRRDRGLSIERCLRLVEQADVLDGQRRLFRECLDETSLSRRERADLGTSEVDRSDRLSLTKKRD